MNVIESKLTIKTCGWCKYVGCGSCRYQCHIEASCALCTDYGLGSDDLHWDTPCVIMKLGDADKNFLLKSKAQTIKDLLAQIVSTKGEMLVLRKLKLPKRPVLADNRPYDFYKIGDITYVFQESAWSRAKVVPGYRSQDGCVSFVLDGAPIQKDGPVGCGASVPCVLKEAEYKYFIKNLSEFKVWLDLQDRDYNGDKLDLVKYYAAMVTAALKGVK